LLTPKPKKLLVFAHSHYVYSETGLSMPMGLQVKRPYVITTLVTSRDYIVAKKSIWIIVEIWQYCESRDLSGKASRSKKGQGKVVE